MKNNCILICPRKRYSTFLLYLKHVFPYKNIQINKIDKKFSNNVIIDPESLAFFDKLEIDRDLKITIMLWNGYYDFIKFSEEINKLKKRIDRNNLDNLNYFFVGNFCEAEKNFIFINNFELKKKKLKFFKEPLTFKLNRNLKIYKRIYLFLKSPVLHTKCILEKKIFFIGYSTINIEKLKKFSNYSGGLLENNCFYFFNNFLQIKNQLSSEIVLNEFKLMLNSEKFKNLPIYNRYYVAHLIFRHFFVRKMKKFNNFTFNENDNALQFYNHNFSKKSFFIDLGSKLGNDKSSRSLIHRDMFADQYFDLCIQNCNKENFSELFYRYIQIVFNFIDVNEKIDLEILKKLERLISKDQ